MTLPARFHDWFKSRGWHIHPHQEDMAARADAPSLLLIAPTGGGKTLAGFLPTLAEIADTPHDGLHTIYVSPLKALAADIKRNLSTPIEDMDLPIRVEDRTGDTPQSRKKRQRADPPHILLTTPESLALHLSYEDAPRMFKGLQRVIVDEIHALAESKRGDQLMLALAELQNLCPDLRRVGLSATVEDPCCRSAAVGEQLEAVGRPASKQSSNQPWVGSLSAYQVVIYCRGPANLFIDAMRMRMLSGSTRVGVAST